MSAGGPAPDHRQSVLVIDDAEDIHDLVDVRLRGEHVEVRHAFDADGGVKAAREQPPDVVLLDLDLPGRSGLEVCRELMRDPALAATPIIFLTGTVDIEAKVQAFEAGAIDYVTKPFDAVELRARVRAALRTKRYHDLLSTRAQLDGLTGLWNRAFFDARLVEDVTMVTRYGRGVALVMIDVDHFKAVNDRCGHPFGDQVLRRVADAIARCLRSGDVACRYGGEEFGLVLREADATSAQNVAERVRAAVAELELVHAGRPVQVTVSVGFAASELMANPRAFTPVELLAAADRGLYFAKRAGRNRVCRGDDPPSAGELLETMLGARPDERLRAPTQLLPGALLGPYEILGLIGGGGSGDVYRAHDPRLLREVAIKVLVNSSLRESDAWRRFAQEARALAALDHPNVVRVFDFGSSDAGEPFIVLELLHGRTLRARLQDGAMSLGDALEIGLELTRTMTAAHDKGIIHRDLKPENVFLTDGGLLKVVDFGLAKLMHPLSEAGATEAGTLVGTVGYLAPEQARGLRVDARSDLFAIGAILYELASGRRAFAGASPADTLHAVLVEEPAALEPTALHAVLRRCLAKNPSDRFASARELEAGLLACRAETLSAP